MDQRPNDVSPEAMQARIQQARREAETLKDRIKRKKDELADTTRKSHLKIDVSSVAIAALHIIIFSTNSLLALLLLTRSLYHVSSPRCIPTIARGNPEKSVDEDEADTEGPPRQDLCHALVH